MSASLLKNGTTEKLAVSSGSFTLRLLSAPAEWDDPRLRRRWEELNNDSGNVNLLYASPVWFDHLRKSHSVDELMLAVVRDEADEIIGVVPVLFKRHPFQYYVSSYPLLTLNLKAAHVLGSVPLLPDDARLHAQLYDALLGRGTNCDCVYMDTVPVESACWRYLNEAEAKNYLVYAPNGARPWHLLRLPASSEAYLSQMSSKTRYTLRKKAKQLAERGGGQLEMTRADAQEHVAQFLSDSVKVSRNSWQHDILGTRIGDTEDDRAWFARLAESGLLRSYLLKCGERPCAFVVGYQFNDVFHYVELGYDRDFAEWSPGTVLLHMLIQDLCDHRPASVLNFGMGDADYKRRFGNTQKEDVSILILRKSLVNRLRINSHSAFRSLVRLVRKLVRRG